MDSLTVKADMRVNLEIRTAGEEYENTLTLKTSIEEVFDDDCLLIQTPIYKGRYYNLPRDEPILMCFFANTGKHLLQVRFLDRILREGLSFSVMQRLGYTRKHQVRDCFRLPIAIPVIVECMYSTETGQAYKTPYVIVGQTKDLSDEGMLFSINEFLEKDEEILLTLDLEKKETIGASVIRTKDSGRVKFKYDVAVELRHMNMPQKHRIYKFIMKKQLESLRKKNASRKPM